MEVDHIFIFVTDRQDVDDLVKFGFMEGSGRTHQGIGTANRRIFFENFYLEFLWVTNETEARSFDRLGIWQRSNFRENDFSPFGLCLENTKDSDDIFKNSLKWHPEFLQSNDHVDIITSSNMPWIFRFPPNRKPKNTEEPRAHQLCVKKLTKAVLRLKKLELRDVLTKIETSSLVEFESAERNMLVLEFDNKRQNKHRYFKNLNLKLVY